MKSFLIRFISAVVLAGIAYFGILFYPEVFLSLVTVLALYELNIHFSRKNWTLFVAYSALIIYGIVSFYEILKFYGWGYAVWLAVTVFSADTFAYLTGSILKGRKLCPSISPNKTISGLIGGVLLSTLSSIYCRNFLELDIQLYAILITIILSVIGDMLESYIKRSVGVKDFLRLIPGHGGLLDRLDSFILSSIFLFMYLSII